MAPQAKGLTETTLIFRVLRNTTYSRRSGKVTISSGGVPKTFTVTQLEKGTFYLDDFENDFVPDDDKWFILDETATTSSFDGIKVAFGTLKEKTKTIALEFTNLTSLPNYALALGDNDNAFDSNYVINDISCPKVSTIGSYAFYDCVALITISFPKVTSIGDDAFSDCDDLADLELATGVNNVTAIKVVLKSIGINVFGSFGTTTDEKKITLTIGSANLSNISSNTLTVTDDNPYTFKKIDVIGDEQSDLL